MHAKKPNISRRKFHKGVFASSLAGLFAPSIATSAIPEDQTALHLNRLTFGATIQSRIDFEKMGLETWLEDQLAQQDTTPTLMSRLKRTKLRIEYEADRTMSGASWDAVSEKRSLRFLDQSPSERLPLLDYEQAFDYQERIRPAHEVIAASLVRAVHSEAQLREVVTQFWHDHFSVNSTKDEATAVFFPQHDTAIRNHALGNFRELLGAISRSPSMLIYLNNDVSRASPANENYGRELLELHTLGASHYLNDLYDDWKAVPGATEGRAQGYIDQDVYEVARAFTGWTVGDGKWLGDGEFATETGEFEYVESWHDPYQKRILGVEFPPNNAKMEDGESVLDLLAFHEGTARFICGKLLKRLGLEAPSDHLLHEVSELFQKTSRVDDQIARVVRFIVLHREFAETTPSKLRRPFEFLAGMYRATGAQVTATTLDFNWWLGRAGWTQHEVRPPTGHSDDSVSWSNTRTLNGLIDLSLFAHDEWFGTGSLDLADTFSAKTWGDLSDHWASSFGSNQTSHVDAYPILGINPEDPISDDAEYRAWVSETLITLSALSPSFMFR